MRCYACGKRITRISRIEFKDGKVFCRIHFEPFTDQEKKLNDLMSHMDDS